MKNLDLKQVTQRVYSRVPDIRGPGSGPVKDAEGVGYVAHAL